MKVGKWGETSIIGGLEWDPQERRGRNKKQNSEFPILTPSPESSNSIRAGVRGHHVFFFFTGLRLISLHFSPNGLYCLFLRRIEKTPLKTFNGVRDLHRLFFIETHNPKNVCYLYLTPIKFVFRLNNFL